MTKRLDINIVEVNREGLLRHLETIRHAIQVNQNEGSDWDELTDGSDTVGYNFDIRENE
jgi:hypothetical protein